MDAHNVTADIFSQTSNIQREDANTIWTSEKLDKSYALAEMLKGLIIYVSGYYWSDSANANDAKGDPASDPKTGTHTSDNKKRKVTDTSNGDLQQKLLSNWTLPIITMEMDTQIDNMITTCSENPHTIAMPLMKEVIMDAARRSARVLWTPKHVSRTGREGNTPGITPHAVIPPRANPPVLIGGIGV